MTDYYIKSWLIPNLLKKIKKTEDEKIKFDEDNDDEIIKKDIFLSDINYSVEDDVYYYILQLIRIFNKHFDFAPIFYSNLLVLNDGKSIIPNSNNNKDENIKINVDNNNPIKFPKEIEPYKKYYKDLRKYISIAIDSDDVYFN